MSALKRYLLVLVLGAIGVTCGLLAYTVGYAGRFNLLGLNCQYSTLGWCLRAAVLLIGVATVTLSWRENPIIPAKRHHGLGLLLGVMGVFWELASIGLIIGFIFMIVSGIGT